MFVCALLGASRAAEGQAPAASGLGQLLGGTVDDDARLAAAAAVQGLTARLSHQEPKYELERITSVQKQVVAGMLPVCTTDVDNFGASVSSLLSYIEKSI